LVESIDHYFKKFDENHQQVLGVEKIKTIGDFYMCAGGFRLESGKIMRSGIVKAGKAMMDFTKESNSQY